MLHLGAGGCKKIKYLIFYVFPNIENYFIMNILNQFFFLKLKKI